MQHERRARGVASHLRAPSSRGYRAAHVERLLIDVGATVTDRDDVLAAGDVLRACQFQHQGFVERGDGGEVEAVEALDRAWARAQSQSPCNGRRRAVNKVDTRRVRSAPWQTVLR